MIYIVMGVSGCGKSTFGQLLAERLGCPFYDGDDFHPAANVSKMTQGQPLNDADREPWLRKLSAAMIDWNKQGNAVLACSALKKYYREVLLKSNIPTVFIYLRLEQNTLEERLRKREGHFFNPSLLGSQFETLEEPEDAITLEAGKLSPDALLAQLLRQPHFKSLNIG